MNREQAKEALNNGKTLTHEYFYSNEFVKQIGSFVQFEDNVKQTVEEFWQIRTADYWDKGWSIVGENNFEPCQKCDNTNYCSEFGCSLKEFSL